MTNENWTLTQSALPPEGEIVKTMDSAGRVSELRRHGKLWFMPDGKMYVYYTPTHWRKEGQA